MSIAESSLTSRVRHASLIVREFVRSILRWLPRDRVAPAL